VCTSVPNPTTTAAASTAESASVGVGLGRSSKKAYFAGLGFRRIHTARAGKKGGSERKQTWRNKSSDPVSEKEEKPTVEKVSPMESTTKQEAMGIFERVSHIHRPTKDEMLAAATGAWQRLRIRTKWSLIRQMRPYSLEDIGAFFSWLLLGHVVWVVVGTTTFLSVAIFLVNSVSAQGA
jgi:distribution and morphology protein 31